MTENEIGRTSCADVEVGVVEYNFLHVKLIEFSVNLSSWPLGNVAHIRVIIWLAGTDLTQTAAPLDLFNMWN